VERVPVPVPYMNITVPAMPMHHTPVHHPHGLSACAADRRMA
jgi:hypothetical protein